MDQHEILLGRALKQCGKKREDYVVSTKLFFSDATNPNGFGISRKRVIEGINASLERLQLDYVDIVFAQSPDDNTPLEESVLAFAQIVKEGKALYWGTSSWSPDRIIEAMSIADKYGVPGPVADQCQYNLLNRDYMEKKYTYLFDKFGYGATTWSPVAGGLLTNKYFGDVDLSKTRFRFPPIMKIYSYDKYFYPEVKEASQKKWEQLAEIGKELGTDSLSVLAIAWTLKNKNNSTSIVGMKKVEYVEDAFKAVAIAKKITSEVEERIEAIMGNRPDLGMDWKTRKPHPNRRLL